jgi:hypothetical protein
LLLRVVYILIFYNIVYKLHFKCSIPCCLTMGSMDKLNRGSNPGSKPGRLISESSLLEPLFTPVPRNLYESSCPEIAVGVGECRQYGELMRLGLRSLHKFHIVKFTMKLKD